MQSMMDYRTRQGICDATPLFPPAFRGKLVFATKWGDTANNSPASVVNAHSLRAGGDTALFAAWVDWVTIQRWGALAYPNIP